jgi:arylsulfatase A-like enzyme
MRAVMVMFDTLARNFLPNYGNRWVQAPNFSRLEQRCTTFDRFYAGSLPCMPARRELHTGKYNFPFRGWGPLEPFDFSVFEALQSGGIYTHLVTDHAHYFGDGGATYHNRYTTWEGFRGQEGDRWVPQDLASKEENPHPLNKTGKSVMQNYANRTRQQTEPDLPLVRTLDAGIEYLNTHGDKDNYFLQIECYDPHEPFCVPQQYRDLYGCRDDGGVFNWPASQSVDAAENREEIDKLRREYAALLSFCDAQLGRVLNVMDEQGMWKDTLLIVNTDHGFLFGEHDCIGKNYPPPYEELVHLPFFIHDPRMDCAGKRCGALAQTVDIAPTLLDYFGIDLPENMDGKPLRNALYGETNHDTVLFGIFGGHVSILDGQYAYMRSCKDETNSPLFSYTLMPTNLRGFFSRNSLLDMELFSGMRFTNGIPCLKMPTKIDQHPDRYGTLLFDLVADPLQQHNLAGTVTEGVMIKKLRMALADIGVPADVLERLGLDILE